MKQPSSSTATKEVLPGTIISNKAEMVQDIHMKMTCIICNIAIQKLMIFIVAVVYIYFKNK